MDFSEGGTLLGESSLIKFIYYCQTVGIVQQYVIRTFVVIS